MCVEIQGNTSRSRNLTAGQPCWRQKLHQSCILSVSIKTNKRVLINVLLYISFITNITKHFCVMQQAMPCYTSQRAAHTSLTVQAVQ